MGVNIVLQNFHFILENVKSNQLVFWNIQFLFLAGLI